MSYALYLFLIKKIKTNHIKDTLSVENTEGVFFFIHFS
jgi:hypothetical protein